ncbi:uncharacterized protein METZ01_LOCUS246153, partial [marine metagenome]
RTFHDAATAFGRMAEHFCPTSEGPARSDFCDHHIQFLYKI